MLKPFVRKSESESVKMADSSGDKAAPRLATAAAALSAGSSEGTIPMDQYLELFRGLSVFLRSLGSVRFNGLAPFRTTLRCGVR